MSMIEYRSGDQIASSGDKTGATMHAVAAKLHDLGFGVRLPQREGGRCLGIVNAQGARSEVTVDDHGYVLWDYWPWSGSETDPADIVGLALGLIGPAQAGARPVIRRALPLKSAVGLALRALGFHVTMAVYETDETLEVTSEVVASNPSMPFCGQVRVSDDGDVTWECHVGPAAQCALAVADTIVPVLRHGIQVWRELVPL
jgi:hypothetical protein